MSSVGAVDQTAGAGAYRARRASPLSGANVPALTRERDSRRIARSALFLATSRAQRTASHDPGMAASTLAKAAVSALRRRDFPIAALRAARPDDRFCRWPTRSGSRRRAPLERRRRCVTWPVMDSCFRPPGAGSSSAAGTVSHGERAVTLRELETRVWARSRSRATRQNPSPGASRERAPETAAGASPRIVDQNARRRRSPLGRISDNAGITALPPCY